MGNKLFVGNLSFDATENDLQEFVSRRPVPSTLSTSMQDRRAPAARAVSASSKWRANADAEIG
jgi:RNA recognition motif-containing protein